MADVILVIPLRDGGMKSYCTRAENSKHWRLFCADTGAVVNIPVSMDFVVTEDGDCLEVIIDKEFAEANVPEQYICSDE